MRAQLNRTEYKAVERDRQLAGPQYMTYEPMLF